MEYVCRRLFEEFVLYAITVAEDLPLVSLGGYDEGLLERTLRPGVELDHTADLDEEGQLAGDSIVHHWLGVQCLQAVFGGGQALVECPDLFRA